MNGNQLDRIAPAHLIQNLDEQMRDSRLGSRPQLRLLAIEANECKRKPSRELNLHSRQLCELDSASVCIYDCYR
jgi:hypothetical protein